MRPVPQFSRLPDGSAKPNDHSELAEPVIPVALPVALEVGKTTPTEADLAMLIDTWPMLPAAIRAGILAMVRTALSTEPRAAIDRPEGGTDSEALHK
jgi:hypothetical protein